MPTVEEIYERTVVTLPVADRLRLASLILHDVTQTSSTYAPFPIEESDEWSEEDMRELSAQSLRRFMESEEKHDTDTATCGDW